MNKELIINDPFIRKIDNFSYNNRLISKKNRILCAVSGGPDSIALLYTLLALKDQYDIEIFVAHLEHGIRGNDSVRDQNFVKMICKDLGIPFYTKSVNVKELKKGGESLEEVARKVRLNFLKDQCKKVKCNKIALGHTFDDQIETIIFRLINGTGQRGITGIKVSGNHIIRPLLGVNKNEILDFLNRNKITYMQDQTNYDVEYSRNRIRYRIIPEMKKINLKYREHIKKFTELISEDNLYIGNLVDSYSKSIITKLDKFEARIQLNSFYKLHPSIKKRIILKVMGYFSNIETIGEEIYLSHRVLTFLANIKPKSNKVLYQDKFIAIFSEYGELVFKKRVVENINTEYLYTVYKNSKELYIKEIRKKLIFDIADVDKVDNYEYDKLYFDLDKLGFPLVISTKKPGDKINLPNIGYKKIKSIFINDKVKPLERSIIPIIYGKEKIAGLFCSYYGKVNRVAKDFMIDKKTKNVLVCSLQ